MDKIFFMNEALKEAQKAAKRDEVPVGAVIVKDNKIVARAHNGKQKKKNATSHAEMEVITKASQKLKTAYLYDADLYVTLEPCAMCAGAIINARLKNLYFGAWDKRFGCAGTLYNLPEDKRFNHTVTVRGGVMEEECAAILSVFFQEKRKK
jgi:tRNA(adenine34) deaminase